MAKRNNTQRVESDVVQGEGSYVVIKRPTFGEIEMLQDEFNVGEKQTAAEVTLMVSAMLGSFVKEWDWVDDNGSPLPVPTNDPAIVRMLTDSEVTFLLNLFLPNEKSDATTKKN